MFIDEAHLIFKNASPALKDRISTIIKLIRSKGVGIFFCTQTPTDIPEEILGQLGLKVQHALRAFTAKDRKSIKRMAENFPISDFYKVEKLLTDIGIGEALITGLGSAGRPTPLAYVMLSAPRSRMGILKKDEITEVTKSSKLILKYEKVLDKQSAYEMLEKRIDTINKKLENEANQKIKMKQSYPKKKTRTARPRRKESPANGKLARDIGKTVAKEITRGILGKLGVKRTRRRSTSSKIIGSILDELF
jgi:DNA helicase HerA-like ATPase